FLSLIGFSDMIRRSMRMMSMRRLLGRLRLEVRIDLVTFRWRESIIVVTTLMRRKRTCMSRIFLRYRNLLFKLRQLNVRRTRRLGSYKMFESCTVPVKFNVAIMLGDNPCQHEFDLVLRLVFV